MRNKKALAAMALAVIMAGGSLSPALTAVPTLAGTPSTTVWRLENTKTGDMLYTTSSAERAAVKLAGWKDDGTAWRAPVSGTPIWRLYSSRKGSHLYTDDASEKDALAKAGWNVEGVGFNSYGTDGIKIYRLSDTSRVSGEYQYAANTTLRDQLKKKGWTYDGVAFYAVPKETKSSGKTAPAVTKAPTKTPTKAPTVTPKPTATTAPTKAPTSAPVPTNTPTSTPAPAKAAGHMAPDAVASTDAQTVIDHMTMGWNLGNTFDATSDTVRQSALKRTANEGTDYETMWGSPVVTESLIKSLKAKGFNSIRIPVTWGHHLIDDGHGNVTVSPAFLKELKRVVDMAYNNNMYVILNTHHDASNYSSGKTMARAGDTGLTWTMATPYQLWTTDSATLDTSCANAKRFWTVIANEFKGYDGRLLFEDYNEVLSSNRNNWGATETDLKNMNRLGQAFVDAVRATGGNNANRVLILQTFGGEADPWQMRSLKVNDSARNAVIEEVHWYSNGGVADKFSQIKAKANYPVLIGEFGYSWHISSAQKLASLYSDTEKASRADNIPVFFWDDAKISGTDNAFGLIDRKTLSYNKSGVDVAEAAADAYYGG